MPLNKHLTLLHLHFHFTGVAEGCNEIMDVKGPRKLKHQTNVSGHFSVPVAGARATLLSHWSTAAKAATPVY